jgi:hypothetical protein
MRLAGVTGTERPFRVRDDHLSGEAIPLGRGIIVIEALPSIYPPEKRAVEAAPQSVQRTAQERPAPTVPETLASDNHIESRSVSHALRMKAAVSGSVSKRSAEKSRCSFCRAELGESLELTIPGSGKHGRRASTGCFCSTHCRNCVLALAALHPSPLASDDFISKRALVTDRLLDLWRQGQGPDPGLVLQAAERAGCGLPTAAPAVLMSAQAGAQTFPLAKSPAIRPIKPSNVAVLKTVERADVPWVGFQPSPPSVRVESGSTSGDNAARAIQPLPRLLSEPA